MKDIKDWNANAYANHAGFVSRLGLPVIDLLAPASNESILDLGCGSGELALEIQKYGGKVLGIDSSKEMVDKSKELGIEAYVKSVIDLDYTNKFDAVFSNAVLHWVKDKERALECIYKALKKEGRFIAEFGGEGNIHFLIEAMQEVFSKHQDFGNFNNPWTFPSAKEYKQLLQDQGFKVEYIKLIIRPTPIDDISNWLDIFANGIISDLNDVQRQVFKAEVSNILKDKYYSDENGWVVDYVRLRIKAIK